MNSDKKDNNEGHCVDKNTAEDENTKGKKLTYKINDDIEIFAHEIKINDLYRSGPYLFKNKAEYLKHLEGFSFKN